MEVAEIAQYAIGGALAMFLVYAILWVLGVVGKKSPAIVEREERGTKKIKATYQHVLVCGPSGAGKTALLNQLATGEFRRTVSSLDSTKAKFPVSFKIQPDTTDDGASEKTVKLEFVDIPGHEHFSDELLDAAENCSAIILMLDAKDRESHNKGVEILYDILNLCPVIVEYSLPILIVCNKQDLDFSRRATEIERDLEKKLEELKRVRLATADPDREFVGVVEEMTKKFEFKDFSDLIQFCETSVMDGKINDILKFIVKKHS